MTGGGETLLSGDLGKEARNESRYCSRGGLYNGYKIVKSRDYVEVQSRTMWIGLLGMKERY